MNAEELKLILDTVKSVADTAGVAGITWICIHYATIAIGHIAVPFAWTASLIMVARYGSKWLVEIERKKGEVKQLASADEIEKTKRTSIELQKVKEETELAKVKAQLAEQTVQLRSIAAAAGIKYSAWSGLMTSELEKIIDKVRS